MTSQRTFGPVEGREKERYRGCGSTASVVNYHLTNFGESSEDLSDGCGLQKLAEGLELGWLTTISAIAYLTMPRCIGVDVVEA